MRDFEIQKRPGLFDKVNLILTVDLPAFSLVDAVEQKWHLRGQIVIRPSRSPDVSVHADGRAIMTGIEAKTK